MDQNRLVSNYLEYAYQLNYKERPPTMEEFLCSPRYMGGLTDNGKAIYPIWKKTLDQVSKEDTKYMIVLSGAIGCLSGETKVSLLDGRELTIPEIMRERSEGKQHWVYSYDIERKKVVPGKVEGAVLSGQGVDNIVEVELDNGEKIECTHNHPFLLLTGEYKKAEDLKPGDRLEPLYRELSDWGYELCGASRGQWKPTFRIVAEELWGVPPNHCVHHKDFQKSNNDPSNLQVMENKEHWEYHQTLGNRLKDHEKAVEFGKKGSEVRWNGPLGEENREKASVKMKEFNEAGLAKQASEARWYGEDSEKHRRETSEQTRERNLQGLSQLAGEARWSKPGARERYVEAMNAWRKKIPPVKAYITRFCLFCGTCFRDREGLVNKKKCCSPSCAVNYFWQKSTPEQLAKRNLAVSEGQKAVWQNRRELKRNQIDSLETETGGLLPGEEIKRNHKVVAVRRKDQKIDVYDLSIEKHHNFALTSGVFVHNTGKSRCGILGMLYTICRVLCLKDPFGYFGLARGGKMGIVFFNLTKSASESVSYTLFQNHLLNSPWFREHGQLSGSASNPKLEFPLFNFLFASPFVQGFGSQGSDILVALLDEIDSPAASEVQREKVMSAYENARRRLESRFVIHGETLGRFFLVASKQERLSFLNTFIAKYKNTKSVMVVDIPLWEAKPAAHYCGQRFAVMVGDVYNPPKILDNPAEIELALRSGFQVIQVPLEYREPFEKDIIHSLRDLAGISVSHIRMSKLFPAESLLQACYTKEPNPVKQSTIVLGLQDKDIDLMKFVDFSSLRMARNIPRCVHVDYAFSGDGDALGLGMSGVSGWSQRNKQMSDGTFKLEKVPCVHTDFVMRIHAPAGDKIPLDKVRKFILDLRDIQKINIQMVTYDLSIATEGDKQIIERAGIPCDSLSLDKDPQHYRNFRNMVVEGIWSTPFNGYLHFELKNLEEDLEKNKIDHPKEVAEVEILEDGGLREVVLVGSKDMSDGCAGSVAKAIELCQCPPDIEIMQEMLDNVKKRADGGKELWWVDQGIQIKREDPNAPVKPSSQQVESYKDLLKRMRGRHSQGGFGYGKTNQPG